MDKKEMVNHEIETIKLSSMNVINVDIEHIEKVLEWREEGLYNFLNKTSNL